MKIKHTEFGETKLVYASPVNGVGEDEYTYVLWVEREEDVSSLLSPLLASGEKVVIIRRDDWINGEVLEESPYNMSKIIQEPEFKQLTTNRKWLKITKAMLYTDYTQRDLMVPVGAITNFATTGPITGIFMPKIARNSLAAVPHDFAYTHHFVMNSQGERLPITRMEADQEYRRLLEFMGVPKWKCNWAYRILRMFGYMFWKKNTKDIKVDIAVKEFVEEDKSTINNVVLERLYNVTKQKEEQRNTKPPLA